MKTFLSETTRSKVRPFGMIAVILFGLGLLCFASYKVLERPRYIMLPIPPPSLGSMQGRWYYTYYIVREDEESGYSERYFLWRREGFISGGVRATSWELLVEYFDDWLAQDGWVRFEEYFDPCAPHLPEADFLPKGAEGYVAYRQPGSIVFRSEPTVCLAVWSPSGSTRYEIVLMTINPSWITRLVSAVDLAGAPTLELSGTPTGE